MRRNRCRGFFGFSGSVAKTRFFIPRMLIVVAIQAQQLPIAAICRIVVMIMVLVVDGQFREVFVGKLPRTAPTDPRIHLKRLPTIGLLPFFLMAAGLGDKIQFGFIELRSFKRHKAYGKVKLSNWAIPLF